MLVKMQKLPELGDGELHSEWKKWKLRFTDYLNAAGKDKETDAIKLSILRHCIGDRGRKILAMLFPEKDSSDDDDSDDEEDGEDQPLPVTLKEVLAAVDKHCRAVKNHTPEAYKFHSRMQKEGESVKEYETALKAMVKECGYKCTSCKTRYEDRLVADRIVVGVADAALQTKLLELTNPSLEQVVRTCLVHESARVNQKDMAATVNRLEKIEVVQEEVAEIKSTPMRKCYSCAGPYNAEHKGRCPARLVTCHKCKRIGHFMKACRQRAEERQGGRPEGRPGGRPVRSIEWTREGTIRKQFGNDQGQLLNINNNCRSVKEDWYETMVIGDWPVRFKIDTGADVNCIPKSVVDCLGSQESNSMRSRMRLHDYNGKAINNFGLIKLDCFNPIKKAMNAVNFVIVDPDREPIIGRESAVKLGLIARLHEVKRSGQSKEEFIKKYSRAFDGIGRFPGQCKIEVKSDAVPELRYKKRIPFGLRDRVVKELSLMEEKGIIERVEYPTDWINNMQIVEKPDGSLRICLDPKPLNNCIKREHFAIPRITELMAELGGMELFTVLDLKNGFWQLVLDDSSSDLTTFMTPNGRFKFRRMPFGINMAPELFQRKMFQMFGDIKQVLIYFDDLCIYARNEKEHDEIVEKIMQRAIENGITFNPAKVQYKQRSIKLMGRVVENGTIRPDKDYIKALTEIPTPTDKSAVHRLLGFFRYLTPFIDNLTEKTENLRTLIRDDVKWSWGVQHDRELDELKRAVTTDPVLRVFDPKQEITIQTDSSKDGVGSVLLQNNQPVAYASRTLSKAEKNWSQIEKELLAVVFACEKFKFYIYGQLVNVESDHKPLEDIMKKDIDDVSVRLQGMLIRLLRFPLIKVKYRPGKEILLADCLSRAALCSDEDYAAEMAKSVHMVRQRVCMSEKNRADYLKTLKDDDSLLRVIEFVESNSWPGFHKLHRDDQDLYRVKDELHVEEGMLFKDHKLVIPKRLRPIIVDWLHGNHMGIDKTVAKGSSLYFWSGMSGDIERGVRNCPVCEKFQRHQQKETLTLEDEPLFPLYRVGIDIFEYMGKDFLSIYDAYSGYLVVEKVPEKSANQMIKILDNIFLSLGFPVIIRADNNPFAAKSMMDYCESNNIKIKFSSPRYPQSNGLAERGVAIAKNMLKRIGNKDWNEYRAQVQEYNTTKVVGKGFSPAELFFGRLIKTRQPVHVELLKRKWIPEETLKANVRKNNHLQEYYYNRNAKDMQRLSDGDNVLFWKERNVWEKGIIIRMENDRSYLIRDSEGKVFHRNRKFIKFRGRYTSSDQVKDVKPNRNESVPSSNEDSVYDDAVEEQPIGVNEEARTRSGRSVREPAYLRDYVRY